MNRLRTWLVRLPAITAVVAPRAAAQPARRPKPPIRWPPSDKVYGAVRSRPQSLPRERIRDDGRLRLVYRFSFQPAEPDSATNASVCLKPERASTSRTTPRPVHRVVLVRTARPTGGNKAFDGKVDPRK